MQVNIQFFGQLQDITHANNMVLQSFADTDALLKELIAMYPALEKIKFAIAVNGKMITANTALTNNSNIALLPPFSGG